MGERCRVGWDMDPLHSSLEFLLLSLGGLGQIQGKEFPPIPKSTRCDCHSGLGPLLTQARTYDWAREYGNMCLESTSIQRQAREGVVDFPPEAISVDRQAVIQGRALSIMS